MPRTGESGNYTSGDHAVSSSKKGEPVVVHYKTGKHHFEVAVEPGQLDGYKASPSAAGLSSLLLSPNIFTNFKAGAVASTDELRSVFDLKSNNEILDLIVRQGTPTTSVGDKRAAAASHREEVLTFIHEHYVNKSTRLPVELAELSKAVDDHKVKIDDGDVSAAAGKVAHSLVGSLTLKEGDITGTLEVTAELVPVALNVVHKYSRVKNEAQANFGDEVKYRVAIKPGDYAAFRSQLDKVTKGSYKFELGQVESHEQADSSSSSSSSKDHKKDEREQAQAAHLHKEAIKADQKAHKHAEENRAKKHGGMDE